MIIVSYGTMGIRCNNTMTLYGYIALLLYGYNALNLYCYIAMTIAL